VIVVMVAVTVVAVTVVVVAVEVVVTQLRLLWLLSQWWWAGVVVGRVSSNTHYYCSCRVANSILLDGRRRDSFSLRLRMMA
jgi:hypothetical protein